MSEYGGHSGSVLAEEPNTLLIVDDVEINRAILGNIFHGEFKIIEAENGIRALELMKANTARLAAVVLDLLMPEMDGIAVLAAVREDETLSGIPIVVASGADEFEYNLKAIELGASDYVSKPIDPQIIRLRVHNAVAKRKTAAISAENRYLAYQAQMLSHDKLTGLLNKPAFVEEARKILDEHPDTEWVAISFDIEKFRVINDIFGYHEGDRVLQYLAQSMLEQNVPGLLLGRSIADNFIALAPYTKQGMLQCVRYITEALE